MILGEEKHLNGVRQEPRCAIFLFALDATTGTSVEASGRSLWPKLRRASVWT